MTVVTAVQFTFELIDEFPNFPIRSFAFAKHFLIWVVPFPCGERKTPNIRWYSSSGTRSIGRRVVYSGEECIVKTLKCIKTAPQDPNRVGPNL